MWVLNFLPNWIFYAMLFIGIAGFSVTYLIRFIPIPAIYIYKTPIQLVSLGLILIGVYMSGAISNDEAWKQRVAEMEVKVAKAAEQSKEQNTIIETKVVNKIQVVKTRGDDIIKYIDREITKYDNQCIIPTEFIATHNNAAERPK